MPINDANERLQCNWMILPDNSDAAFVGNDASAPATAAAVDAGAAADDDDAAEDDNAAVDDA